MLFAQEVMCHQNKTLEHKHCRTETEQPFVKSAVAADFMRKHEDSTSASLIILG